MGIRLLIVLFLLAATPGFVLAEPSGPAQSVDGDTLNIARRELNLFAVVAPAPDQVCQEWARQGQRNYRCGAHARAFLDSLIAGRRVECVLEGRPGDGGRGAAATCYAAGQDLGLAMIRAGWAVAARRQSDRYVSWEDEARRAKAGLWGGTFTPPDRTQSKP